MAGAPAAADARAVVSAEGGEPAFAADGERGGFRDAEAGVVLSAREGVGADELQRGRDVVAEVERRGAGFAGRERDVLQDDGAGGFD